MNWNYCFR